MSGTRGSRTLVVIGAGTMGRDIALVAMASGYDVRLVDIDAHARTAAEKRIAERLPRATRPGCQPGSLTTEADLLRALERADAVIEAVPELPDLKKQIFGTLGTNAAPQVLLASNTSTLSIADLAEAAGGSPRVVGTHFFNPPHRMTLVEVVTAPSTSESARIDALELCRNLGKEPIVVADVPGFVTSRLGLVLGNEAMRVVEEGTASPEDVDKAMRLGYNHPMGPLELADLVGLDARLNNLRSVSTRMGRQDLEPPQILIDLVERGHLGRKSGRGFFSYDAVDGTRLRSQEVDR